MKNITEQSIKQSNLIDPVAIKKLQEDFNSDVLMKIIEDYRSQAITIIALLVDAYAKNDFDVIKKESHRLKGSSISLGAAKMAMISRRLELSMEQHLFDQTERELKLLEEQLEPTIFLFKKLCRQKLI